MTSNAPPKAPRQRSLRAGGAASILCAALTACSNNTPAPPDPAKAPGGTAQSPATFAQSDPSLPPATPTDATPGAACALLTVGEVTTATGKPMTIRGDSPTICAFSATADPSELVYVQLYLDPQAMATEKDMVSSGQHVPGLGDNATYGAGIIFVQKGNRGYGITMPSLTGTGPDAPPAQILTLAHAALPRF